MMRAFEWLSKAVTHKNANSATKNTVYTLRLCTGFGRGAGLTDPLAGVLVCLIGQDGSSCLHRIPPLNDPETTAAELEEICKVADKEDGANCTAVRRPSKPVAIKQRFQSGSIDEISFLGPELGPLNSIMVAPEGGSWQLDEISVASARTGHMDRFICREAVGEGNASNAGFLAPVPVDSVVYGSGESAVVLSKEQAAALHRMGMLDYSELKSRLNIATSALVVIGTGVAYTVGDWEVALPFAMGGMGGLFYQWSLQQGVDAIPAPADITKRILLPSAGARVKRIVGSTTFRFFAVTVAALGLVGALEYASGQQGGGTNIDEARQVLIGIMGFLMYKLALVGVSAAPPTHTKEPALEDA
ncbi:hypothetical protein WJX72_000987 [[Myrmecia] bisecta]|uniref:DUF7755 domain-containing protein n=1 Tax=[Myrmecia] bisecta TaxID=41462 RepID=A0AAW1R4A2_9CHLO